MRALGPDEPFAIADRVSCRGFVLVNLYRDNDEPVLVMEEKAVDPRTIVYPIDNSN